MNRSHRTENYQLVPIVFENGLAPLQAEPNEVQVEFFASKEQHMMQLYCSRYLNNADRFYWRSMRLCYANPPFSHLAKVLTQIALEGARVILFFFCKTSPKSLLESPQEASPSYKVSPTSQVTVSGWGSRDEEGAVDSRFAFEQNN